MHKKIHQSRTWSKFFMILFLLSVFLGIYSLYPPLSCLHNESSFQPLSAIGSNVRLYVLGAREPYTIRGENFTIYGYAQKLQLVGEFVVFENTSGLPVYPIIDGLEYNGIGHPNLTVLSSNIPGHVGEFNISYQVPDSFHNWDISSNLGFTANITEIIDVYVRDNTVVTPLRYQDIISEGTSMSVSLSPNLIRLPGETVGFTFTLYDEYMNHTFPAGITKSAFKVFGNGNASYLIPGVTIATFTNGIGSGSFLMPQNLTSLGVNFTGYKSNGANSYYEYFPTSNQISTLRALSIEGSLFFLNLVDISDIVAYRGDEVAIYGDLTFNGGAEPVVSRTIEIYRNDTLLGTNTTTADGSFYYQMTTLELAPNSTTVAITLRLQNYDISIPTGNATFLIYTTFPLTFPRSEIPTPPDTTPPFAWWKLIIPIVIVGVAVVGLIIFQRRRMELARQRDLSLGRVNKSSRLAIVTALYQFGKGREAIAYTYRIYLELIIQRYRLEKETGTTIREFAILMVTKFGQDPLRIYPYIQLVESAIYGALVVDQQVFNKAILLFGRVYNELTGIQLEYNLPGVTTEIQPMNVPQVDDTHS